MVNRLPLSWLRPPPLVATQSLPCRSSMDGLHVVILQSVLGGVGGEDAILQPVEAGVGADPEASLRILGDGEDRIIRQSCLGVINGETAILEAIQTAAVRADPEIALAVLVKGKD